MVGQQALGELKRMARFMAELNQLESVLQVAANQEQLVQEAEKRHSKVLEEIEARTKDLTKLQEKIGHLTSQAQDLENQFTSRKKEIQEKESTLVSETGRKLETMKNVALAQVEEYRMELAKLQPLTKQLREEKVSLENSIKTLKDRASAEMEKFISAFK